MKKLITYGLVAVIAVSGAIFYTKVFHTGAWTKTLSLLDETRKPTSEYSLIAKGWNVRVYEFVPKNDPDALCVFGYATDSAAGGCFKTN